MLIEVDQLSKRFGPIQAVDGVTFGVARGEVLGFLGPNGAGKSTTMRMITGFLSPNAGTISVCGHDMSTDSIAGRGKIGYLPEGAPLYGDMTARELFRFVAAVRGLPAKKTDTGTAFAIKALALQSVLEQPIETLSKGFKRRVGFALAILHDPEVLVLDEPTDGLDPNQKHEVRLLIRELARDKAIILSTHILEEVDAVCTRAIVISRGKIVADGTPSELAARSRYFNAVRLAIKGMEAEALRTALAGLSDVKMVELVARGDDAGAACIAFPKDGRSIVAGISRHIHTAGWEIDEFHVESGRLDDVFRSITVSDRPAEIQ